MKDLQKRTETRVLEVCSKVNIHCSVAVWSMCNTCATVHHVKLRALKCDPISSYAGDSKRAL